MPHFKWIALQVCEVLKKALQPLCEPCRNDDISRVVWRVSDEIQRCTAKNIEHLPWLWRLGTGCEGVRLSVSFLKLPNWWLFWCVQSCGTKYIYSLPREASSSHSAVASSSRAAALILQQRRQTNDPPLPTAAATAANQPATPSVWLAAGLTQLLLLVTWAHILKHFGAHTSTVKSFIEVWVFPLVVLSLIGYQEFGGLLYVSAHGVQCVLHFSLVVILSPPWFLFLVAAWP